MFLKYFILFVTLGGVFAQESSMTLPPEVAEKISEEQIKAIQNKSEEAFKELCDKNGGPDAYPKAKSAFMEFTGCINELVDKDVLMEEVEKAKPTGQVDEVFKKYCDKMPQFKSCFLNLTESMNPCVTAEEQANLKTVYNITEQLAEFVCYKEGDRIALFISEHGPECIQERAAGIQDCLNKTMGGNLTVDTSNLSSFSVNSIPKIRFGEKECGQFSELQTCVVGELEGCASTTSANLVEALFKFIRKSLPCAAVPEPQKAASAASPLIIKSITMALLVVTLLI
ncbi:27 kDa glycoprotein-like isoform X2 [Aricia agestis]|uniref:27 kDa glycoprotein-like isoform X2 n=1 Tax=Aricia agestis TaxID=91739 RepID=UPI001C20A5B8|nr:27 kDa glycoprotein-like isoform X2 [Aricia agestis]